MKQNLFDVSAIKDFNEEVMGQLVVGQKFRLQRIVSSGQSTPENHWYDQDDDEWVVLLSGSAEILFQENEEVVELVVGDYLHIKAHQKHRVTRTDPDQTTIWLALHFHP